MRWRRSRVQKTEQRHAGDRVEAGAQCEEAKSRTTHRTLAAGTRRAARGLRTTRTQGADSARAGRSRKVPRQTHRAVATADGAPRHGLAMPRLLIEA